MSQSSNSDDEEPECVICGSSDQTKILTCDFCDDSYHVKCMSPKLQNFTQEQIKALNWHCHKCKQDLSLIALENAKERATVWKAKYQEINTQHQLLIDKLVKNNIDVSNDIKDRPKSFSEAAKSQSSGNVSPKAAIKKMITSSLSSQRQMYHLSLTLINLTLQKHSDHALLSTLAPLSLDQL